jgi:hypothetical protein
MVSVPIFSLFFPIFPAEEVLAYLAICDRLVREADGGYRSNAIREIPD